MSETISIALCTCNGEAFLKYQLNSIAAQTRLPDELVVGDDASTDRTLEILSDFAASVPFPVHVESHAIRRGVSLNFESAVKRCTGSLIAFCDQDDVWKADKLERLEKAMIARPNWALVFHDLELVDSQLNPLGQTMWGSIGFNAAKQRRWDAGGAFELLLKRPFVTGAGLMLRHDRLARVLPFSENWIHDAWLSFILSTTDQMGFLREPLTEYRQHASNEIGGQVTSVRSYLGAAKVLDRKAYYALEIAAFEELVNHVKQLQDVPAARITALEAKLDFLKRRQRLPAWRLARIPILCWYLLRGDYRRYGRGWALAVKDVALLD